MPLMPAFHRFPNEASLIGRMLVGFGDLEFMVATMAGEALGDETTILRTIFRLGSTSARIDAAETLAETKYKAAGLETEFKSGIGAVRYCYSIRNQYAHCHWADDLHAGLFFTNLEDAAERSEGFRFQFKHVDLPLLAEQEAYFLYAMDCIQYTQAEYPIRTEKKSVPHPFRWPTKPALPPKHNPPKEHVPPWLSEDGRRRHIALAEEQERSAGLQLRKPRPPKPPSRRERRDAAMKGAKE